MKMRSEKGSITLFITISMSFFLIIVTALYINSNNNIQKQNKEIQKIQEQYIKEDIDLVYEKSLNDNKQFLRDIVEVGDYIKYEIDTVDTAELITELGIYSGSTVNTSSSLTQETDLNWRVLDIIKDENGKNCVMLISETPTTSTVSLSGYNGYNNAVYLLDKICNTLYNNSEYVQKVQNLKIEDIEKNMITKPVSNDNIISPTTLYYPSILEQEKDQTITIGEETITGDLRVSEQIELINQTETKQVTTWDLKTTYWTQNMTENSLKEGRYELLFKQGQNNYKTYWISSRCIDADDIDAFFNIFAVYESGEVGAETLYESSYENASSQKAFSLRPVIILKSDILVDLEKSGDGSEVGKEIVLKK